jgi:hypothetical protein
MCHLAGMPILAKWPNGVPRVKNRIQINLKSSLLKKPTLANPKKNTINELFVKNGSYAIITCYK